MSVHILIGNSIEKVMVKEGEIDIALENHVRCAAPYDQIGIHLHA